MQNPKEENIEKKDRTSIKADPQLEFKFGKEEKRGFRKKFEGEIQEEQVRKTEERGEVKGEVRERVKYSKIQYTNAVIDEMLRKGLGKKKYEEFKYWTKNHPGEEMSYEECQKYVTTRKIKGEKDKKEIILESGETGLWASALKQRKWESKEGLREMMKELFGIEVSKAPPRRNENVKTVKKYTNAVMHEILKKGLGEAKYAELKDWTKKHPGEEMSYEKCFQYVSTTSIYNDKKIKKMELENGETGIWRNALAQRKWITKEGLRKMMKELFDIEVSKAPTRRNENVKTVKEYTNEIMHEMLRKGLGKKKYAELKDWAKNHPGEEMSYEEMLKYVSTIYIKGEKDRKEVMLENGETGIWNSALQQRKWITKEGLRKMMKELFDIEVSKAPTRRNENVKTVKEYTNEIMHEMLRKGLGKKKYAELKDWKEIRPGEEMSYEEMLKYVSTSCIDKSKKIKTVELENGETGIWHSALNQRKWNSREGLRAMMKELFEIEVSEIPTNTNVKEYLNTVMYEMLKVGLGEKKYQELKDWTKKHPGEEMSYKEMLKYVSTNCIDKSKKIKTVELENGETGIWKRALEQRKWDSREGLRAMMKELFEIEVSETSTNIKEYLNAVMHEMLKVGLVEAKYEELKYWTKNHPEEEMGYEEMLKYVSTSCIDKSKKIKTVELENGETGIWNSALIQRKWNSKEGLRAMMKELFCITVQPKEQNPQNLILSPKFIGGVYELLMEDEEITIIEAAEKVEEEIKKGTKEKI